MITMVGAPSEEALSDIRIIYRIEMINLECDCE